MNGTKQQSRTVILPVMTVTYELRSDMLEQMTLTEPKKEEEEEEVGPEEEEEVGQEETGVELVVVGEDWDLVKAHCVFAGIKQRYLLAFDNCNISQICAFRDCDRINYDGVGYGN